MNIEIDQSSKVEYTSKNTIVAYSNTKQKALSIRAEDKRKIQEVFREAGKPDIFVYKTFAVLVYLLIKDDLTKINSITIDIEYEGKNFLVKNLLLQAIRKDKKFFDKENIHFRRIGKKNNAHKKALNTYQGKIQAETIVEYKDLLFYII